MVLRRFAVLAVALLVVPAFPTAAPTSTLAPQAMSKIESGLAAALAAGGFVDSIILLHDGAFETRQTLANALNAVGAKDAHAYEPVPLLFARLNPESTAVLDASPLVVSAGSVGQASFLSAAACTVLGPPIYSTPWWLGNVTRTNQAHAEGFTGTTHQVVAFVDSGVAGVNGMGASFLSNASPSIGMSWSWWDNRTTKTTVPTDACGHGTAVASVIEDPTNGVAPNASWIAAAVTDDNGVPRVDSIFDAYAWLLNTSRPAAARPDVVVNSFGIIDNPSHLGEQDTFTNMTLQAAFRYWIQAFTANDILPVFAAGNYGLSIPATLNEALAVGAIDINGTARTAIGPGPYGPDDVNLTPPSAIKPDLFAPGEDVTVNWKDGTQVNESGSSFAAPFAAGVALLVRQAWPHLSAPALQEDLRAASNFRYWQQYNSTVTRPNTNIGYGILNAMYAITIPARSSHILFLGDYDHETQDALNDTTKKKSDLNVISLTPTPMNITTAENMLPSVGTMILGNLDSRLDYSSLIRAAQAEGTGLVFLGDAGLAEFDGVQAFTSLAGGTMNTTASNNDLVGVVRDPSDILPHNHKGDSITLATTGGGSSQMEGFTLPGANPVATQTTLGTLFARQQPALGNFSQIAILADSMTSSVNSKSHRTELVEETIRQAVIKTQSLLINASRIPIDVPQPKTSEVVVVGDHNDTISNLVLGLGYTVDNIPEWDYDTLNVTLHDISQRVAAPKVRTLVFNDLSASPDGLSGEATLATICTALIAAPVAVVVLASPETGAFSQLSNCYGYEIAPSSAANMTSTGPHDLTTFAPTNTSIQSDLPFKSFNASAGWTTAWRIPNGATVSYFDPMPPPVVPRKVILGGGATDGSGRSQGSWTVRLTQRAIAWATRFDLTSDLFLENGTLSSTQPLPVGALNISQARIVINGLYTGGHAIHIRNTSQDVTIVSSEFAGAGPLGVEFVNATGNNAINSSVFQLQGTAISVDPISSAEVHFDSFISNNFSIVVAGVPSAKVLHAESNYFSDTNLSYVVQDTGGSVGSHQVPHSNAIQGNVNIVPFYTRPDFQETQPCVGSDDIGWAEGKMPRAVGPVQTGLLTGVLSDLGATALSTCSSVAPATYQLVTTTGRTFSLSSMSPTGVQSIGTTASAPNGWSRTVLSPSTGQTKLQVASIAGRGLYDVTAAVPVAAPYSVDLSQDFSTVPAGWSSGGSVTRLALPGANGAFGYESVGAAGGSLVAPFAADAAGISAIANIRSYAGSTGRLSIDRTDLGLPTLALSFTDHAVTLDGSPVSTPWASASWHKVELREHAPWADLLVDNLPAASWLATSAPVLAGNTYPLVFNFSCSAACDVDDVVVSHSEKIAGALQFADFENGLGPVVAYATNVSSGGTGGGGGGGGIVDGRTGTTDLPVMKMQAIQMSQSQQSRQSQPSSQYDVADPRIPRPSSDSTATVPLPTVNAAQYATSGGTPAYMNTQSMALVSSQPMVNLGMFLPGNLTRYAFQEDVSIATGQSFNNFGLLDLRDSTNQELVNVSLSDDNTFLDVTGSQPYMNVAPISPGLWHKLSVIVSDDQYSVLVDDVTVLTGTTNHPAPVSLWAAGGGVGSIILDNLRFGYSRQVQADASDSATMDPAWTMTSTSAQPNSGLRVVSQVPESPLPSQKVENPPLASRVIHLYAPSADASITNIARAIPTNRTYDIGLAFYLPNPQLAPAFDGFHLFRLDSPSGFRYSIMVWSGSQTGSTEATQIASGSLTARTAGPTLAAERWHLVTGTMHPDGSGTFTLDGVPLPPLAAGAQANQLTVGDTSSQLAPQTTGATGSGEVYVDDYFVVTKNTPPTVTISKPTPNAIVGGITTLQGNANDPDAGDAVSSVNLSITNSTGSIVTKPLAVGTTTWNSSLNSTLYPYGAYTLSATATDSRDVSQPAIRVFTIDNRPVGGVLTPAIGSSIGGIVTVSGTALPKFPANSNETVDTLQYRIDSSNWSTLTAGPNGTWQFAWNTTTFAQRGHTITVRATEWLDTSTWTASYTVDNSPNVTVTSPSSGAALGGVVTITGYATNRYPLYAGDLVDSVDYRIDNGVWITGNITVNATNTSIFAFMLDTHVLAKGAHTFTIRGTESNDSRTVTQGFASNNTPVLSILSPEPDSSVGGTMVIRGSATDLHPATGRAFPDNVTVLLDGNPINTNVTNSNTSAGRVDWAGRVDTHGLAVGNHTLVIRAKDGLDVAQEMFNVSVNNTFGVYLDKVRFDSIDNGSWTYYNLNITITSTNVHVHLHNFVPASNTTFYLYGGQGFSQQINSTGNDTEQDATVALPGGGLGSGTYSVVVENNGPIAGDFRIQAWITDPGKGGPLG